MKKFKFLIFLFAIIQILNSCDDEAFLELKTPLEAPWQSLQEFDKAPIGAYRRAFLSDWHNIQTTSVLLKSFQADEAFLLPGSKGNVPFGEMYNRQTTQQIDKTQHIFAFAYQVIAICNGGIDFLNKNDGNPYKKSFTG